MADYPLVLLPLPAEGGGGWLVVAPDLDGCLGDGGTPEEALEDFAGALAAWSEVQLERGDPMPRPGSFLDGVLAMLSPTQAEAVRRRLWEIAPIGEPPAERPAAAAE